MQLLEYYRITTVNKFTPQPLKRRHAGIGSSVVLHIGMETVCLKSFTSIEMSSRYKEKTWKRCHSRNSEITDVKFGPIIAQSFEFLLSMMLFPSRQCSYEMRTSTIHD